MQLIDARLWLSPSDVSAFVACPHLTQLESRVSRGELKQPFLEDEYTELLRRKGEEHEAAYLGRLKAEVLRVVTIPRVQEEEFEGHARQLTEQAIRAGDADVIYQACFNDGRWRGFADFLERQPGGGYEPVDTKLARAARPVHVLQLCFYADQVGRIQGRLPERMHVHFGTGERETFRTSEYIAYYRRVRTRFLSAIDESPETYPWPCEHCPVCVWRRECHKRLVTDDNLVLVAGLGQSHA